MHPLKATAHIAAYAMRHSSVNHGQPMHGPGVYFVSKCEFNVKKHRAGRQASLYGLVMETMHATSVLALTVLDGSLDCHCPQHHSDMKYMQGCWWPNPSVANLGHLSAPFIHTSKKGVGVIVVHAREVHAVS
jgi:hypothetical protein